MGLWKIVLAGCAACWLYWLWSRRGVYHLAKRLPSANWALPVLGHSYLFFGHGQDTLFGRMREILKKELEQMPYSCLWIGPELVAIVTKADYVKKIIFSQTILDKGDLLHAADPVVGNGMLFGSGAEVKRHRKGFLPSMKAKILEDYLEVFHRHSRILVQVLKQSHSEGAEVHLEEHLHHCTFDAINETTLETRTDCQVGSNRDLCTGLIDLYGLIFQDIVKPWLFYGKKMLKLVGVKTIIDRTSEVLNEHLRKALRLKEADLQKEKIKEIIDNHLADTRNEKNLEDKKGNEMKCNSNKKKSKNMKDGVETKDKKPIDDLDEEWEEKPKIMSTLEFMLRSGFEISEDDLIMELKNLFLASSDTVATIGAFLFKMFAIHPEYQELAYREVVEVLEGGGSPPSLPQLARLQWLDRCVRETLRLFPIAPLLVRRCTEPLALHDKLTLPVGTTILIGAFWLHRSSDHWSKPNQFWPNHFSPEQVAKRHPAAFIPFSGGGHSCIGQQYAMLFLKCIVASVLLEYRIEPVGNDYEAAVPERNITLKDDNLQAANRQNAETDEKPAFSLTPIENITQHGRQRSFVNCQDGRITIEKEANCQNCTNTFENMNGQCQNNDDTIDNGGNNNNDVKQGIPADYVARMNLGSDISVRLVGGVHVKLFSRNK